MSIKNVDLSCQSKSVCSLSEYFIIEERANEITIGKSQTKKRIFY